MGTDCTHLTNNQLSSYGDMVSTLSRTLAAANHLIAKLLAEEGLANLVPSHGDILLQLFARDEISMAELADTIGKDPSTVTALVKKLVDAGYVKTAKSMSDRRVTLVSLTKAGLTLEPSFLRVSELLCTVMASNLTEDELIRTKDSLLTMKQCFEEESGQKTNNEKPSSGKE